MATKKDSAREKALQEVKMYQSNDWELVEETPEYFLLRKNTQSIGIHIVLLLFTWWTFGISNLLYWLACRKTKKIVK